MMVKQSYTVCFVTPAFLGNWEQQGQWRTPPFKALLRQWWRVAAAKDYGYNHERLREAEGRLFGNAWIENDFRKSEVRLRLDRWSKAKESKIPKLGSVCHPEVTHAALPACPDGKGRMIEAGLYLGYGPIQKTNAAIQADDRAELHLAYPEGLTALADVFQLMHWFGALGGRSRNGWGSLLLEGGELKSLEALNQSDLLLEKLARPLKECLDCDWPHAIGQDDQGLLVWASKKPHNTWREAMMELARTKIEFRTNLAFAKGKGELEQRHVLAYPVTNHSVNEWEKYKVAWAPGLRNGRLANQLRFKVTKTEEDRYQGIVYHLPCGIPTELLNALSKTDRNWIVGQQLGVWQSVHAVLDQQMQRIQ